MNTAAAIHEALRQQFVELLERHSGMVFKAGVKAVSGVDLWASWPACVTWTAVASAAGMLASYLFDRWARTRDHTCGIYVGYSVSAAQAALDEVDQFARN